MQRLTYASLTVDLPGFGPTTFKAGPPCDYPSPIPRHPAPFGVSRGSFRVRWLWSKREAKEMRRFICAVMAKTSRRSYKRRPTSR
jgi:hypothetical protein